VPPKNGGTITYPIARHIIAHILKCKTGSQNAVASNLESALTTHCVEPSTPEGIIREDYVLTTMWRLLIPFIASVLIPEQAVFGFVAPYQQLGAQHRTTRHFFSSSTSPGGGPHDDESETLASLTKRLAQLRQADVENPETARLSLLYSRLSNIQLDRTQIDNSAVAGRGLYARCDCQKGDLLTCYPGDALVIIPDDEDWTVLWGDHVAEPGEDIDSLLGYIVHVNDDIGILALPSLDQDPAYLGHFANDGVITIPTTENDLPAYVVESEQKANAMHNDIDGGSHMATIATRDIAKGEEIFVSYGTEYWMEQPSFRYTDDDGVDDQSSSGRGFG
jgi:hypothetical protein